MRVLRNLSNCLKDVSGIAALPLEEGLTIDGLTVIAEQDVLGDRLVRRSRKKKGSDFISEVVQPFRRRYRRSCGSWYWAVCRAANH